MSTLTDRVSTLIPNAKLVRTAESDKDVLFFGPPGTGKTTALLTLLDAHLRAGAPPSHVMVATFTRNARKEVQSRLARDFGLVERDLPWVRTIHSSAYALLSLSGVQIMGPRSLEQFGRDSGFELRGQLTSRSVDDPYGTSSVETVGDWCYVAEELRRAKLLTCQEAARQFRPPPQVGGWDARLAEVFATAYKTWKKDNYLLDFTDMLELVVAEEVRPEIRWMFVDECQDLTPLQWKVIDTWSRDLQRRFCFGDDDQALFSWSGADPQGVWDRPGHRFVLSHSYRLPAAVHAEANRIIQGCEQRVEKDFAPHGPGGSVATSWFWGDIDYRKEGSWLILARNRMYLNQPRAELIDRGVPFKDRTSAAGVPDPESGRGRALRTLFDLHHGRVVMQRSWIRSLRDHVHDRFWPVDNLTGISRSIWTLLDLEAAGATPALVEAITKDPLAAFKCSVADRNYLMEVRSAWGEEALLRKPQIELSTIHGAKGEESDHVVVGTNMTRRTFEEYQIDPDSERRVFYVAASRAKESLTWLKGGGKFFFDL